MKKLLIATTALVGTAGVVAADVTFSGYGRFGIQYDEDRISRSAGAAVGDPVVESDLEETRLESRFRMNIDASTETDGGVRFAVRQRIQSDDDTDGEVKASSLNAPRFQVSAGGFRVRVGNISGVTDASDVVNFFGIEPGLVGKTGMYATFGGQVLGAYDAYSSTGKGSTGINVKYEIGDFAVMGSWTDDFDADEKDGGLGGGDRTTWELGASYTFSGWTLGGVYGEGDYNGTGPLIAGLDGVTASLDNFDYNWWVVTATGSIGAFDLAAFVGDTNISEGSAYNDKVAYGISGSFPVGAATDITASIAGGGESDLDTAFGIGFAHSLGGGVNLKGMAGQNEFGNTIADLGVVFNF